MAEPKPGDELRDLSARLLAFQYGDPQTEKRSIGKKVDVYFEYTELGKKKKLFVEAKDHSSISAGRKSVIYIRTTQGY